ncbi:hypothetical protein FACS1894195_2870 [Bacteroidia bacterium]|nr:hypothetical protein FACS1894195_2870 [Bacteroidia bacterium]
MSENGTSSWTSIIILVIYAIVTIVRKRKALTKAQTQKQAQTSGSDYTPPFFEEEDTAFSDTAPTAHQQKHQQKQKQKNGFGFFTYKSEEDENDATGKGNEDVHKGNEDDSGYDTSYNSSDDNTDKELNFNLQEAIIYSEILNRRYE